MKRFLFLLVAVGMVASAREWIETLSEDGETVAEGPVATPEPSATPTPDFEERMRIRDERRRAQQQAQRQLPPSRAYRTEASPAAPPPAFDPPRRSGGVALHPGQPAGRAAGTGGGRGESYWRGRAAAARNSVSAAEKKVAALEAKLRELGGHAPGPLPAACAEGRVVGGGGSLSREEHRVCDPMVLRAQESQRVHAQLQQAQAALARAEAALRDLPGEARRAGAQPGWVR